MIKNKIVQSQPYPKNPHLSAILILPPYVLDTIYYSELCKIVTKLLRLQLTCLSAKTAFVKVWSPYRLNIISFYGTIKHGTINVDTLPAAIMYQFYAEIFCKAVMTVKIINYNKQ